LNSDHFPPNFLLDSDAMHFLSAIVRIVIIDLVLSGDNAVVIGMAAHRLEPKQRRTAILFGGAAAIGLRITLTAIAALLMQISGLRLVGGLLLIWIGFKLLAEEEESHDGVKVAASMKDAIITILVADFIMSLDNVLAVAGASEGHLGLLLFGLILSMAILMFVGNLVADLINKFWWLAYLGSAVIAWTGASMVLEDSILKTRLESLEIGAMAEHAIAAVVTILTLSAAHWFHRVREKEPKES
jgi:YjbE family integral membrane protein